MTSYYLGRNSIGDAGEVYYTLADCPEVASEAERVSFRQGVRDVRGENFLNADTEWDGEGR